MPVDNLPESAVFAPKFFSGETATGKRGAPGPTISPVTAARTARGWINKKTPTRTSLNIIDLRSQVFRSHCQFDVSKILPITFRGYGQRTRFLYRSYYRLVVRGVTGRLDDLKADNFPVLLDPEVNNDS